MPLGERKEAEMKPTPRSERMGIIADALMAARNFADKAQVPESVPLIGGQGLGSLVLGKAPEELNEMSYGNMPMRINPLAGRTASYVPEMKAGRKEQVADLAMLAGVPKVGKAGVGFAGVGDVGSGLEKSGLLVKKADDVVSKFGTEPKKLAKEGQDVFEALNITPEKKEQWRSSRKVEQRSSLLPEIEDAAEKLYNKQISPAEFRALSVEKQPIKPFDKVPDMPSFEDIASALKDSQVKTGIVGVNLKLEAGTKVASRLDIPAYNDYDTWVVSLHDGTKKSGNAIGYAKTAVLKDVEFKSDPKTALDIARRKPLAGGGRMGKATIARIFGEWVPHDPAKAKEYAETVMNNKEWSQVGMNPYRASYFYDKSSGLPVISAEEVIQVGPLVLAKKAKTTVPDDPIFKVKPEDETSPTFAKGGMMKPTIKGFQDGGMNVDPVSGNDVPVGSLPEEVRDDVDAKLSPGEFVIPADVVRFIGLERLMKMRDEAKKGIQRMSEIGQMGNADEVGEESNSTYEDDDFESEIDDILGEVERESNGVAEQTKMAFGGYVGSGTDLTKAPKNPVFDVRYYKNKEGATMFITHINGKPMTPVPEGFTAVSAEEAMKVGQAADEEAAAKKKLPTQDDYGYSDTPQTFERVLTPEEEAKREEQLTKANAFLTKASHFVVPGVALAQKAAAFLKGKEQPPAPVETRTPGLPFNEQQSIVSSAYSAAINAGVAEDLASLAAARVSAETNAGRDINTSVNDAVVEAQARQDMRDRGGGGAESSVGAPSSDPDFGSGKGFGSQDLGSFLAKGGLVSKRQYPTKKKKGKGIAASK